MIKLVYWESNVWNILANDIVHVKYKRAYKIKLMVLNSRHFPESTCGCGHYVVLRCRQVRLSSVIVYQQQRRHCQPKLRPVMLHYHRYSGLVYGSPDYMVKVYLNCCHLPGIELHSISLSQCYMIRRNGHNQNLLPPGSHCTPLVKPVTCSCCQSIIHHCLK